MRQICMKWEDIAAVDPAVRCRGRIALRLRLARENPPSAGPAGQNVEAAFTDRAEIARSNWA
jgi:hypothetical protein